ncbi:MAG: hypothetical protein Kow0062_10600 [Acidobacteriota bacterium]
MSVPRVRSAVVLLLLATSWGLAAGKTTATELLERTEFSGDLRLRYEGFRQDGSFDNDRRDRFRIRLRFGFETAVTDRIRIGVQLRSGNPDDPVSANQTLDGGFTKKDISIAQAFADFELDRGIAIRAGKFDPGKLWHVSDMQWDDDVVVEGAMERWSAPERGSLKGVDVRAWQYVLEESGSGDDAYLFGAQVSPAFRLGERQELRIGLGYDHYVNPEVLARRTDAGRLGGNPLTNRTFVDGNGDLQLVSDFRVVNLFGVWKLRTRDRWPVKVSAFVYRNLGTRGAAENEDSALFVRVQVGDYKQPGRMAFRLSRYLSEADALFYAFTQSDTTFGSDLDVWRADWRLGLRSKGYVNVTWYRAEAESAPTATLDRWQVDYILKF